MSTPGSGSKPDDGEELGDALPYAITGNNRSTDQLMIQVDRLEQYSTIRDRYTHNVNI